MNHKYTTDKLSGVFFLPLETKYSLSPACPYGGKPELFH